MSFLAQTCDTTAINQKDNVPGRIQALGLFNEKGIPTTDIAIEFKKGIVELVQSSLRGGNPQYAGEEKREIVKLQTTHLLQAVSVIADEFQNLRPFGDSSYEDQVQDFLLYKLESLKNNNEATFEYQRAGALVGKVLDKDGSVILDIHKEFGLEPVIDELDLSLGTTKKQIRAIKKKAKEALKVSNISRWVALCGPTFFDSLEGADDVRESFLRFREGEVLRQDNDAIQYASVVWEEYDAFVGDTKFIEEDEAILVPVVDGLCITRFAPADYVDTVDTMGVPHYARAEAKRMNRGFDLECQSNPISLVTVPDAVRRIKLTASA